MPEPMTVQMMYAVMSHMDMTLDRRILPSAASWPPVPILLQLPQCCVASRRSVQLQTSRKHDCQPIANLCRPKLQSTQSLTLYSLDEQT